MCAAAGYNSGGGCSASQGNMNAIESIIDLAVTETNQAYANSNIPTKLRLVHKHFDATYDDYNNQWETTLNLLRGSQDGQLDYVHSMRDQYGADFVAMLVDTGSYCGIGYRPNNPSAGDAFSLTKWSCATGYYSFGHEIAHNMGCNHDRNNAGGGNSNNYGFQYNFGSSYNDRFRSIMAYDCKPGGCPRVPYFSSSSVMYKGSLIGNSGANNADWIRNRLTTYANFRQNKVGPPTPATPTHAPTPSPTVYRPTSPPTNEEHLETTLGGGFVGGAGNIFDVRAKKDITVSNFAVHSYAATTVTVEVWKKRTTGTAAGSQSDQSKWEMIGQATFTSGQAYTPSILPPGSFPPVFIKAGDVQAFYVTFTANTNYNRYSTGSTLGKVQASNDDLEVMEGYAKGYRFADDYFPRVWNGRVYYETGAVTPEPTPVPMTPQPTPVPTPDPTPVPTPSPTRQPVDEPTDSPTAKPTGIPTPEPTPVPTTLAPVPAPTTSPPSRLPTDGNQIVEQLTTLFAGGNGQAGNMVEIKVNQDIRVTAFDIHTYSTANVQVYIYYMKGSYVGFEQDASAWTEICNTWVKGKGSPNPTHIDASEVEEVAIDEGETYSFYVTLTESKIRYTNGVINANDSVVEFIRSSGMKYPFGGDYPERIWNGNFYYRTDAGAVTSYPTPVPNNSNGPSKQLQTTFANRNGSYGSMFDIEAKEDLIIHNVWIHTYHQFGAQVDVEVYKLKKAGDSFAENTLDSSKWELVGGAVVEGRGTGYATQLPPGAINEILVPKGTKQALYVTIVGGGIRYTNGVSVNDLQVHSENDDIKIFEGAGVGAARFGGTFTPRVFNGVLEYYTPNVSGDASIMRDMVTGKYEGLGGLKDEGWPCDAPHECKTGKCGLADNDSMSNSIIANRIANRGSGRRLESFDLCLDENGDHLEDGDAEAGTSKL